RQSGGDDRAAVRTGDQTADFDESADRISSAARGRSEDPPSRHHQGAHTPRLGAEGAAGSRTEADDRLFPRRGAVGRPSSGPSGHLLPASRGEGYRQRVSSPRGAGRGWRGAPGEGFASTEIMKRILLAFIAGFLATIIFHQ